MGSDRGHPGVSGSAPFFIFILPLEFKKAIDDFVWLGLQLLVKVFFYFFLQFLIRAVEPEVTLSYCGFTWYLRRELVDSFAVSKMASLLPVDILSLLNSYIMSIIRLKSSDINKY